MVTVTPSKLSIHLGSSTYSVATVWREFFLFASTWVPSATNLFVAVYALILQAANQGTPVINLNIAPQHQELWDRWVQTLMSQRDLPDLQYLIPLFDGLFHLAAVDQNIIISDSSNL